MSACARCGATKNFQFRADARASKFAVDENTLPLVCRGCGLITVAGVALQFPEAFERNAMEMAEAASTAAQTAVAEISEAASKEQGNGVRLEKYFTKVYREAYLDGFLRAVAFYSHHTKEGKLKRLRELWAERNVLAKHTFIESPAGESPKKVVETVSISIDSGVYEEFNQLMMLGPVLD